VIQQSLGGHAVPLDPPTLRVARRLGLLDPDLEDLEAARASLEHLVPKPRGSLFGELISSLAADVCLEDEPRCSACPLSVECPSSLEDHRNGTSGTARSRTKPR
jgi:endonuclease-3